MRAARSAKALKSTRSAPAPVQEQEPSPSAVPPAWSETPFAGSLTRQRRFSRVPTHVVGVAYEKRSYPRAALRLALRLVRVAGHRESKEVTLVTRNISSSGVYFLSPQYIKPGTPIELEVALGERPLGRGSVRMTTVAHIVRAEPADSPGWHGLAASFDDISFHRDEYVPRRFRRA